MDQDHQDPFAGLPDDIRKQITKAIAGAPAERTDEIVYEVLAASAGLLTKEELLAIDLREYDPLRTYPAYEGTDWQLMRNRVLFLQTAVRMGIPWPPGRPPDDFPVRGHPKTAIPARL